MGWGLSENFYGAPNLRLRLIHILDFSSGPVARGSPLPAGRVAHFQ